MNLRLEKLDQNTLVPLGAVAAIFGFIMWGAYVLGRDQGRLDSLDAIKIEQRLTAIETTLKFMAKPKEAGLDRQAPFWFEIEQR